MTLFVRRISAKWVGRYNLFEFIQDSFNDYPMSAFSDREALKSYLVNLHRGYADDDNLIWRDAFSKHEPIWLFVIDKELEKTFVMKAEFNMVVNLLVIGE